MSGAVCERIRAARVSSLGRRSGLYRFRDRSGPWAGSTRARAKSACKCRQSLQGRGKGAHGGHGATGVGGVPSGTRHERQSTRRDQGRKSGRSALQLHFYFRYLCEPAHEVLGNCLDLSLRLVRPAYAGTANSGSGRAPAEGEGASRLHGEGGLPGSRRNGCRHSGWIHSRWIRCISLHVRSDVSRP
jgi:hypothetical protein